ncbi:MAG: CAP domain-containing protein [Gemmatimonadetes bacterium]|nr:CAP domain-containing protein [Gemmatimonadota bacterium]
MTAPRSPRIRWLVLAGALLSPVCVARARTPPPADEAGVRDARPPEVVDSEIVAFLILFEATRARAGCSPLRWDAQIASVAHAHSADMVDRRFFSHTNPDTKSPFDRLLASGIGFRAAAENIARSAGPRETHDGWLDSPGHRSNMLDCTFTHHGVGRAGTHWTHLFVQR